MKQGQDLQARVALKCLENVLSKEQDEKEKERVLAAIRRVDKSRDRKEATGLNPTQSKMYHLLVDGFVAYKECFQEMVRLQKYRQVAETYSFDVNDYLLSLQPNININKAALTVDNLISKYTFSLLKLKKDYDRWPKDIASDWSGRAKEKLKPPQSQPAEPPAVEPPRQEIKKRVEEKRYEDSDSDENYSQEPRGKPQAQSYRVQREPQRRQVIQKPRRVEPKIELRIEKAGDSKDSKFRLMERFLQTRKDLHIERARIKQVVELLTSRLDNFLRKSTERMVDIASLRNKRNPKQGNEIGYFSAESMRVHQQAPFYFQPNSKVFMLQYKHKLEVYTTLRAKEIKKEDDLRAALEACTSDNEKKVDKKIQNYILKPRPKEVQPVEIFKEQKDTGRPNNQLTICTEHAIFFLQSHRFLRNSQLLFNAYHY